ncbi:MAG: dihydrodipicolinate synthase family protein [Chloroflexota bacterium]
MAGADAVSAITPFFISPSADELYDYFVAIARAGQVPVLLYDSPLRTGVNDGYLITHFGRPCRRHGRPFFVR